MHEALRPMEFGQMVRRTWELTRATAATAGPFLLLFYLLMTLMVWGMIDRFFEIIPRMMVEVHQAPNGQIDPETVRDLFLPMYGAMLLSVPLSLLGQFITPYLQTATIYASWEAVNGRRIGLGEMFRRPLRRSVWMAIAQQFIIGLIGGLGGAVLMPFIVVGTAVVIPVGIAAAFGLMLALIYFIVAISLGLHFVVVDDRGPWKGLIASITLVKGDWWRAFGLLASIWFLPFLLSATLGAWMSYGFIEAFRNIPADPATSNPAEVAQFFANLAAMIQPWQFMVYGVVNAVVLLLILNAQTVLFVDLRARRGDFLDEAAPQPDPYS